MRRIGIALAAWVLCSSWAGAAQIVEFSPKGTVATVQSIKLALDVPAVAFGDSQSAPPVEVVCNDPLVKGQGRWLDERRWTYEFTAAPGPGVRCTVDARNEFRTLSNEPITGKTHFTFQTGGPRVVDSRPWDATIDEDQVFVLRFNGAVDTDSMLAQSRCIVEGLGEAVPLRLVTGQARQDILKASYLDDTDAGAIQVLQCKRRLPADAKVQLKVGPGVTTPAAAGRAPVASTKADVFNYTVRKPFKASLTCLRENSSMPCTPVAPVAVEFTAPISQSDAARLRLKTSSGELAPSIREGETYLGPIARVQFDGPFPEKDTLMLSLPEGLKDEAGRDLVNADQFPLAVPMAGYPPLVKFAAAPFGVIERFAEARPGVEDADVQASVPLTVRNVEAQLRAKELTVSAGKVSDYVAKGDAEVLRWYARVRRLDNGRWTAAQLEDIMADKQPRQDDKAVQDARTFSALDGLKNVRELSLPGLAEGDVRPFEVVGVPVSEPGFHVLEVASARLGRSLVESGKPMVVRSSVLVTNLGVHVKKGRDDLLAWVTTLDEGSVVPDADITVLDCSGIELARGRTNEDGIWHQRQPVAAPDYCEDTGLSGVYVSARIAADHPQARGKADFSFVFSDWNRGIESWRFNVPTDTSPTPTMVTHTVFDRTLLRAGETVSMKHFARIQTRDGLALPDSATGLPDRVLIEHQGSDQRYEQAVTWEKTPSGGMSASGKFDIARTARLGVYTVRLTDAQGGWFGMSEFRVEEFKLPLLAGTLQIVGDKRSAAVVAPRSLDADLQISYVSGGPASQLPVQLSAVLKNRRVIFAGYEDYSFDPPMGAAHDEGRMASSNESEDDAKQSLFLNKKAVVLDKAGSARVAIDSVPAVDRPRTMVFEASFADPNGQIQTLAQSVPVWPARVQAGIRAGNWLRAGELARFDAIALSPDGEPQSGVAMEVRAVARTTYSTRKRLVGGFYSYDNHTETRDLGTLCEGTTAADGVMTCSATLDHSGSVELVAVAADKQNQVSRAATPVWVTGSDDLWFGGENDDRIDIIPAKKVWAPGETATFQVRMPFRQATALLAIEREGVLQTQVVHLGGKDPGFSIPVDETWGPNVYVSVLALRGRIHSVPWYSFFASGWKSPVSWRDAFLAARKDYVAPTALIDLAKPAFRYGLAEIRVTDRQDQLDVKVSTDKSRYQLRERVDVSIAVTLPDGTPAAHGTVAFAAVDQALLELAPNTSWDLLDAMRQFRSYGVETATAQMEVVGRRHYGRKAMPAGGGGGKSPTRELLDTLLLWQPAIQLDDQGRARLSVALNDAITQFQLVAIADYGPSRFGTGSASVSSSQDLQVIPGLPALVREGDRYDATVTVRNTTGRAMQLAVSASYSGEGLAAGALEAQRVTLAPGTARQLIWPVRAPENTLQEPRTVVKWVFEAREGR
ncbi:MAG TPA: MG2 domain-containing protein, partial [Burkholderiaceae bacterium]|nr:MG2 domain-containing protein [Burkholderiaceae bacterium]